MIDISPAVEDLLHAGLEQGVREHMARLFTNYASRAAPSNKTLNLTEGINDVLKAYEEVTKIIGDCCRENT